MPAHTSIIIRVEMDKEKVSFGEIATSIGAGGGDIVAIDVIHAGKQATIRDLTINIADTKAEAVIDKIKSIAGVRLINVSDRTFLVHLGGKIEINTKSPMKNRDDLSRIYTPGVARVCEAIQEDPNKVFSLTIKRNSVAVISDGTAVLGLGDIGPQAAMPVMEGKAALFKQLAGVDAFPLCLDTKDPGEIVAIVKALAPTFGGINLEDISSPRCFEIEEQLQRELDIPVFHDDQHGTAVVMMAGLLNALKIVQKSIQEIRVVVLGIGAAGAACSKMLLAAGVSHLIAVDREGPLHREQKYPQPTWQWLAERTNPEGRKGSLSDLLKGADVFIGVSRAGLLKETDLQNMNRDPIIFAMANPEPEIDPERAEPYARVIATGRSDYPNQINNVLCFPGMFRGALDCRAKLINEEMKLAAARAIASVVTEEELNEQYIIPSIFNDKVVSEVRSGVIQAALHTGVARRTPPEFR